MRNNRRTSPLAAEKLAAEAVNTEQCAVPPPLAPTRLRVLEKAAQLTGRNRNYTYGSASTNLDCLAAMWEIYERYRDDTHTVLPARHEEAMHMVFAKISRIACGDFHIDNYTDGAAYLAIAVETVVGENNYEVDI